MSNRSYWWVTQGQNFKEEYKGGYIFAPDDTHYSHKVLKDLKNGDVIVHYAKKEIRAISVVKEEWTIGKDHKGNMGLKVKVDYEPLQQPIRLDEIKEIFGNDENREGLPNVYCPFTKNLDVNSTGYLYNFNFESYFCLFCQNNHINSEQCKNSIFLGPPGTGKTYNLFSKAVEIIDPNFPKGDPKIIFERFNELRSLGLIEFCTFHQSFSYEEFIEGFRYDANEKTPVVKDGVLKKLSILSSYFALNSEKNKISNELKFEDVYEQIIEAFNAGEEYIFKAKSKMEQKLVRLTSENNLKIKSASALKSHTVSKNRLKRLYNYVIENNVDMEQANIDFVRDAIGGANSTAYWAVLKWILDEINQEGFTEMETETTSDFVLGDEINEEIYKSVKRKVLENINDFQNFNFTKTNNVVLIIDELNRGNISKIFGELISLIEEDKRFGMDNSLNITLPYSQELFSVPPNLYILGTMNTADRSIALMDIALRRRFNFKEIMPDDKIIKKVLSVNNKLDDKYINIIIGAFNKLNKRIEVLLDKNYQIGHSYFVKIKNPNDLISIWNNEIIPLILEYFYNDWEKIELLIGSNNQEYSFILNKNELVEYQELFHINVEESEYPKEIKVIENLDELLKTFQYVFNINEE